MITSPPVLSFDNTEIAFAHKSDKDLKEAHFLFQSMSYPWLVKLGTRLTPWAIKSGLPVKGIIRSTIFKQFVGGETLEETIPVVQRMARFNVQVILDYGVEGMEGENSYDHARDEFIRVINFAASPSMPSVRRRHRVSFCHPKSGAAAGGAGHHRTGDCLHP